MPPRSSPQLQTGCWGRTHTKVTPAAGDGVALLPCKVGCSPGDGGRFGGGHTPGGYSYPPDPPPAPNWVLGEDTHQGHPSSWGWGCTAAKWGATLVMGGDLGGELGGAFMSPRSSPQLQTGCWGGTPSSPQQLGMGLHCCRAKW